MSSKGDSMRGGSTSHRGRGLDRDVERQVRGLLDDAVHETEPTELVAVSCIADVPDSWFAKAVLKHSSRLEVVVPAGGTARACTPVQVAQPHDASRG
ncbi:hypothetical protein OHS81_35475 [Streptomyces sp. NBC_00400]|uniref:hypothetical protein n=1 Tax=Streptomyces sp. NBC_00400 TaxID=2975737 RepID=UPI002E1D46D3